ncbi:hypothetical protein Asfd1_44 [Aeromonas phage Asfd_1]|nr:hypothetical protein Asfd1_44 [Aeromonas phage Asfd_1]
MISNDLKIELMQYYKKRAVECARMSGYKGLIYTLRFTKRKDYVGQCDYVKKTISLSETHYQHMNWDKMKDTINHELAHMCAPRGSSHGPEWQRMAVMFGASPTKSASVGEIQRAWCIMFGNEIVGYSSTKLTDIGNRYIRRRKRETMGKLYLVPNADMIDNSTYVSNHRVIERQRQIQAFIGA